MMQLSPFGAEFLLFLEGLRLTAYQDTAGVWTIGVGHTGPEVKRGLVWTREKCLQVFRSDVKWAEDAVNRLVTISLNQDAFDALVCLVFNIGVGSNDLTLKPGFTRSEVRRLTNQGRVYEAADAFMSWSRAGGNPNLLRPRRYLERALFLKSYPIKTEGVSA